MDMPVQEEILIGIILTVLLIFLIIFYYILSRCDKVLIKNYNAIKAAQEHPVHAVLSKLAESGTGCPEIYITDVPIPGPFTAANKSKASIIIPEDFMVKFNDDEINFLLSRELMRMKNGDIYRNTILALLGGSMVKMSYAARWGAMLTGFGDYNDPAPRIFSFFVMGIFAPPSSFLIQKSIEKEKECQIDADAARLCKCKRDIAASAISKLEKSKPALNPAHNHLFAVDSVQENIFGSFFKIHPSLDDRLLFLQKEGIM